MVYNKLKDLLLQDEVLIREKVFVSSLRWHFIVTDKRHAECRITRNMLARANSRFRALEKEDLPRIALLCHSVSIDRPDSNRETVMVPFLVAHAARLALEHC